MRAEYAAGWPVNYLETNSFLKHRLELSIVAASMYRAPMRVEYAAGLAVNYLETNSIVKHQ